MPDPSRKKTAAFAEKVAEARMVGAPLPRARDKARITDRTRWIDVRREVLDDRPTCQHCGAKPAKHVEHAKPFDYSERNVWGTPGMLALCDSCYCKHVHLK